MARIQTITISLLLAACTGGTSTSSDNGLTTNPDPTAPDAGAGTGSGGGSGSGDNGGGGGGTPDPTQPTFPSAHPRIYLGPNRDRLTAALQANTPAAAAFKAKVDQWVGGASIWGFDAWNAALMGQLTGDPKYCAAAIVAVEKQVSTAEAAMASGSAPAVASDSYLDIGPMVGDVALVYDWCFDAVTTGQRARWLAYADQAISNVWHHDTASWAGKTFTWSGWATDDPSDNYYYSFLRATMLVGLASKGEDPQADAWIQQFHDTKIMGELVPTFTADLAGGGSREGTGYGVAMRRLFEMYDWWKASTGENLSVATSHARKSMLSFMHQMVPTLDRFAPTGDQSRDSTASLFDYQRNYLQELIELFPSDPAAARGKTMLAQSSVPAMTSGFMFGYDFLYDDAATTAAPLAGMGTTYYARGIGELYARSSWDKTATWVNLIAGPYTQSHAHQDQGSLMIYKGAWLAYDAVIDSHSGLTQATTAHSLVRIDQGGAPVTQVADTQSSLKALHTGAGWVYASADVTPAYNGKPAVVKDQRDILYLQPDVVVVYDRVSSAAGTTQTWQLASPATPAISGATTSFTNGGHTLHVQRLAPSAAVASAHNMNAESDYAAGYRLDETMPGGDQRYLHVLGVDGAVQSATVVGDTATIVLADGRNVVVAFNHDAPGATLAVAGVSTTLDASIETLPE